MKLNMITLKRNGKYIVFYVTEEFFGKYIDFAFIHDVEVYVDDSEENLPKNIEKRTSL